jgi:hypothetical protein
VGLPAAVNLTLEVGWNDDDDRGLAAVEPLGNVALALQGRDRRPVPEIRQRPLSPGPRRPFIAPL